MSDESVVSEELVAAIAALPVDTSEDPVDLPDFLDEPEPVVSAEQTALIEELAKGDLIAVADKVEVSVPAMPPTDAEVQAVLEEIAPGAFFRLRCNMGPAIDTFVVGGIYAPGIQRWVQTPSNATALEQAQAIKESLG